MCYDYQDATMSLMRTSVKNDFSFASRPLPAFVISVFAKAVSYDLLRCGNLGHRSLYGSWAIVWKEN
jgi:hypothetical protein